MTTTTKSGSVPECAGCFVSLTGSKYVKHESRSYCVSCFEKEFAKRCASCGKLISVDQREVMFKDSYHHDTCFTCTKCGAALVEKPFAFKNKNFFCLSCYDRMSLSKCHKCGLSFEDGQTTYEFAGKHWHDKCFQCRYCQCLIESATFVPQEDDMRACISCYEKHCALKCSMCCKIITKEGLKMNDTLWHCSCFNCSVCNASLTNAKFAFRDKVLYCQNCYMDRFSRKCTLCNKPITGEAEKRYISFEDKSWHCGCFECSQCQSSLVGKGFITTGDKILCPTCAKNI